MRTRIPLFLVALLSSILLGACTDAQPAAPPTASDSVLTSIERAKIDVDFRRLMNDGAQVTDIPSIRRDDGTRAYMVRIVTSDVDALRKAGVPTDSAIGGTVWTHLSLAEIRGLSRLKAVTALRADNEPRPRLDR